MGDKHTSGATLIEALSLAPFFLNQKLIHPKFPRKNGHSMHIWQAKPGDSTTIHEIGCRSYRHNFTDTWSAKGLEKHLQTGFTQTIIQESLRFNKHSWFLISLSPDAPPVGFAALVLNSPIPHCNDIGLELQKLYFLPEASGQGCGKYLMEFIAQYALENNYLKLWLDVLKSNTGAIRFYKANGFEQMGELPFKTDLLEVGQWVMVKPIAYR